MAGPILRIFHTVQYISVREQAAETMNSLAVLQKDIAAMLETLTRIESAKIKKETVEAEATE
jgi:hypothetical protein